jgi:hypothetical protein
LEESILIQTTSSNHRKIKLHEAVIMKSHATHKASELLVEVSDCRHREGSCFIFQPGRGYSGPQKAGAGRERADNAVAAIGAIGATDPEP